VPLVLAAALLVRLPAAAAGRGKIFGTVDAALTVDPTSALVYVEDVAEKTFAPPAEPALVEQRRMQFVPHVLPILRGTTVRFPNVDRVRHNVFSPSSAKPFNFGIYYPREARELTFDKLGVVTLLCNIHEQMLGYVVVLQNPYFTKVAADGTYAIEGVPDGRYTVALWSERSSRPGMPAVVRGGPVEITFTGP
jgi:plastocyanin